MKTTHDKGSTPKSTFIALARAISLNDKEALSKWIDAYRAFVADGCGDKMDWATRMERACRGSKWDTNKAGTIRVNLSHIEWAEQHIRGGASACRSLAHIIRQKSEKSGKTAAPKAKDFRKEAMKYSVKELEKMLAFRKAAMSEKFSA